MPKAFKIAQAMSLPRWWVWESFGGSPFKKAMWWKPQSLVYQDDDAAFSSRFAGTFVRVNVPSRNLVVLRPYEFTRHMISHGVIGLLRTRLMTAKKCRGWSSDDLGMSASTMATHYLGCNHSHLIAHLESLMTGAMSWSTQGQWHIDHIRPLRSFDLRRPEDAAAACHFTNLQPLWKTDNLRKGGRFMEPACASQH